MINISKSSDIVIQATNISKQYKLGVINHGALYRDLQSWWARVRGFDDPNLAITDERIINRDRMVGDFFQA